MGTPFLWSAGPRRPGSARRDPSSDRLLPSPPSCNQVSGEISGLIDQLRITGLPGLVVEGLKRAIQAKDGVPPLAGVGLDPVILLTVGCLRTEIHVVGTIGVLLQSFLVAVDARETLVGLQHAAGLVVAEREGPEVLGGNVRRQVDLVGLAAVEGIAVLVQISDGVLGSLAHVLHGHGRGDAGGVEVHVDAGIEQALAVQEEVIAALDERVGPDALTGLEVVALVDRAGGQGARGDRTDGGRTDAMQ